MLIIKTKQKKLLMHLRSLIGYAQAQEPGIITVNINEIESSDNLAKQVTAQGKLTKEVILKEYKDCFDKVGRFPDGKYHMQLIDKPLSML